MHRRHSLVFYGGDDMNTMVLFHGKTKYCAERFRIGQLTTYNPHRGAIDIYRANGKYWDKVASWDSTLCEYLDGTGAVFRIKDQAYQK